MLELIIGLMIGTWFGWVMCSVWMINKNQNRNYKPYNRVKYTNYRGKRKWN